MNEDAVFAATAGLKKPLKHLMLGIALKSLTDSRKVIKIMIRLGHCVSYHTIEEFETKATFESTKQNLLTPLGMKLNSRCGTGVVWDILTGSLRQLQLEKHYLIQLVLLTNLLQKEN